MTGGGGEAKPTVNGGEFLLQLLKNPPQHPNPSQQQQQPPSSQIFTHDPAVAAIGPSIPRPFPPLLQSEGLPPPWSHGQHHHSPPPFVPHNFFFQIPNPSPNPNSNASPSLDFPSVSPAGLNHAHIQQQNIQLSRNSLGDGRGKLEFLATHSKVGLARQKEQTDLIFGSLRGDEGLINSKLSDDLLASQQGKDQVQTSIRKEGEGGGFRDKSRLNGLKIEFQQHSFNFDRDSHGNLGVSGDHGQERSGSNSSGAGNLGRQRNSGHNYRTAVPPLSFVGKQMPVGKREHKESRYQTEKGETERRFFPTSGKVNGDRLDNRRVSNQLDSPGRLTGSNLHSLSASDTEESMVELHCGEDCESGEALDTGMRERMGRDGHKGQGGSDDLDELLMKSVVLVNESEDKSEKKKHHGPREKDYRSDKRGQSLLSYRMRYFKRQISCRGDVGMLNAPFLAIYESLIPVEEEKTKQKQLLALLEKIVGKEWPDARLYVYGSCANSFGFSKSDIDVCLTISGGDFNKSDVLLKLADMLQSDNLQNVQALTRARVPIVKLTDPATGISCDICINNMLAVVNTKLLRDYAEIDVRLRQLAFIVKHWAKSRGVNETYQGTLSSYAYVLMCIHFLQQRRPAILPCLQAMKATYSVTVNNVECTYFDQVENLNGFGSHNSESIAQLVWAFFNYWAYFHDYANDVISVRTGSILSKHSKDWTTRIGNDRHLICIEDPFEVSHDLGRVVDRHSIKVLKEEFERAAAIMQYDPNPCVKLFEPYIRI